MLEGAGHTGGERNHQADPAESPVSYKNSWPGKTLGATLAQLSWEKLITLCLELSHVPQENTHTQHNYRAKNLCLDRSQAVERTASVILLNGHSIPNGLLLLP